MIVHWKLTSDFVAVWGDSRYIWWYFPYSTYIRYILFLSNNVLTSFYVCNIMYLIYSAQYNDLVFSYYKYNVIFMYITYKYLKIYKIYYETKLNSLYLPRYLLIYSVNIIHLYPIHTLYNIQHTLYSIAIVHKRHTQKKNHNLFRR